MTVDTTLVRRDAPRARRGSRVYCTYFDVKYLARGLALWRSLREVAPDALLCICCLDQATLHTLERLALPGMRLFALEDLECRFPQLAAVKPTRSRVEYYFTCTPSVLRFVIEMVPEGSEVTYLDADLYFFADPEPLFLELERANGSIGIIAHRFPDQLKDHEEFGLYNVGWLTFLRDERAIACLEDWQRRCIEWCYARAENGKFADQKYLDDWPGRFDGVVVLENKGANVALWNLAGSRVAHEGGRVTIDGAALIFYHFHGVTPLSRWLFEVAIGDYHLRLSPLVQQRIYRPYLTEWRDTMTLVGAVGVIFPSNRTAGASRRAVFDALVGSVKDWARQFAGESCGKYLVVWPLSWIPFRGCWLATRIKRRHGQKPRTDGRP